ncbi:MAG: DUF4258 domain-containing protein [Candidatus Woesearchaeota archaeon]
MFIFKKHALEKMDGLGIEKDEVKSVITKGMKWKEKNTEKWHARAFGIEVVFSKKDSSVFIITVYLED